MSHFPRAAAVTGALVAIGALAACSSPASAGAPAATTAATGDVPPLTLYAAMGYDSAVAKAFTAKTGIPVNVDDDSTGPLLTKITAEKNNPQWSLFWADGDTAFAALDQQGFLLPYQSPSASLNAVGAAVQPKDHGYSPTGTTVMAALIYNAAKVTSVPTSYDDLLTAAYQGKVACFEISTRNVLWSREISTARSLANDEKNLYVVDDTDAVQALDKKSGSSVWKQDKLLYRSLPSPAVYDGKVVVGDVEGYLHVLSPDNGAIIGRLATDGTPIESLVPGLSGLFVQTAGGAVLRVRF
jgi:outer membrane protein assembly factor BamB